MATRSDLQDWVEDAVKELGGSATVVQVARRIWDTHEAELRASGDLLYTWQYDMRWAAMTLRKRGIMNAAENSRSGVWELARIGSGIA
jgi:hypothetical protein